MRHLAQGVLHGVDRVLQPATAKTAAEASKRPNGRRLQQGGDSDYADWPTSHLNPGYYQNNPATSFAASNTPEAARAAAMAYEYGGPGGGIFYSGVIPG